MNVKYSVKNNFDNFSFIEISIKDQSLSCTISTGLFYNYHGVTLLHLERQISMLVYALFNGHQASVVIDLICEYLIIDTIDHTIALCNMMLELQTKARKTLTSHHFNNLFCPFMESEMKIFVLNHDGHGSIAHPTFTRALKNCLKRSRA